MKLSLSSDSASYRMKVMHKLVYEVRRLTLKFLTLLFASLVFVALSTHILRAQSDPVIEKDIVYATVDGVDLKLDMARPLAGAGPYPAVLHFHGGGWQAGDKSHGHGRIVKLANAGYVAVSVGYRFAPKYSWPLQVYDAKSAVLFLKEHAKEYNIDPDRIGVTGDSAGGYLALMLGFTDKEDGFEGPVKATSPSTRVQAVVSFCSAGDFTRSLQRKLAPDIDAQITAYYKKPLSQVIYEFTGTRDPNDPKLVKMSAKSYVNAGDPPVLIFQGELDPLISMEQVTELQQALQAAHVPVKVIVVKGGAHGWYGTLLDETEQQMINFLDERLKP
jgi:acetyl esterase/lipase